MIKRKNILKIAIDSPAAAGAGTLAKAISKQYNLFYLDTGKIYRMIAYLKLKFPKKFSQNFIKLKKLMYIFSSSGFVLFVFYNNLKRSVLLQSSAVCVY